MDNNSDLIDAVTFFQRAFTIVLALALGEAFKQFVADADKDKRTIHWDRLPALLTFLFMIFPFFHGMNRYIFTTYIKSISSLHSYAGYLMFDGIIFMAESATFFVMSRSLANDQWRRFLFALVTLLAIDSFWIVVEYQKIPNTTLWLVSNFLLAAIAAYLLHHFKEGGKPNPMIFIAVASFVSAAYSYYVLWKFYFPPPAQI